MRFSGPIGTLLAASQEAVIHGFLPEVAGREIVDVGTGTGKPVQPGVDGMLEKHRVEHRAGLRRDAEGDVGYAQRCPTWNGPTCVFCTWFQVGDTGLLTTP